MSVQIIPVVHGCNRSSGVTQVARTNIFKQLGHAPIGINSIGLKTINQTKALNHWAYGVAFFCAVYVDFHLCKKLR